MKILDVGQCGFDGPRMARQWHDVLGAEVDGADTSDDAVEMLQSHNYDVVLVNRVLAADESSGLEVISRLHELGLTTPMMLVSDLPEAQDAAVRLGAVRGFGKAHLGERSTLDLVSRVARGSKGRSQTER
jgi:DNA-binding NarL/FixJ family response regulator